MRQQCLRLLSDGQQPEPRHIRTVTTTTDIHWHASLTPGISFLPALKPGFSSRRRFDDRKNNIRDLAEIPAVEVITRSAVMLMSAAAEKLGLSAEDPDDSPHRDLDEARRLITALAGLVAASAEYLGPHAGPVRDGLKSLQLAFRESSAAPDEPGQGPGEKYTGPVW